MKTLIALTLNGRARDDAVPDNMLLVDYLREIVGLTGTKIGCDGGECDWCADRAACGQICTLRAIFHDAAPTDHARGPLASVAPHQMPGEALCSG